MPKGYWIAHVTVTDAEQYQHYAGAAPEAFRKFGATILARGGAHTQMEGEGRPRNVVIEFPSLKAAQDWYNSPNYQAIIQGRLDNANGCLITVEGYEG